jgi:hypothetical protein
VLELTHNWDTKRYEIGTGYGHVAIGVDDIYATCARLRENAVKITREPGPMQHGSTVIAFVEDPDGYKIELIRGSGWLAYCAALAEEAQPSSSGVSLVRLRQRWRGSRRERLRAPESTRRSRPRHSRRKSFSTRRALRWSRAEPR